MDSLTKEEILTEEELSRRKRLTKEELNKRYRSMPERAKDMMFSESVAAEISKTAEMYGLRTPSNLADNVGAVMLRTIALSDLPSAIEIEDKVKRRIALQAAIRVSRHILKPFSQYVDIGNVDAYIEEWKEELTGL